MKVCIFSDFPVGSLSGEPTGRGGGQAATWLPPLARSWEKQTKHEIHWCVFSSLAHEPASVSRWNQIFHCVPSMRISASMLMGRWPHRLACRRIIKSVQPDIVHCWGTENLNGSALCEYMGPSILSMQGIISAYFKTGDLRGWRWRFFRHWEACSLQRATMVTSESQWGLDRVAEITPEKLMGKVEYGVAPSFYDVQWAPNPDHPRIFFAGGLNRLKGVDILLRMLKQHPLRNWKMVFAGAGYLEDELRALNDPQIEILGTLKTSDVREQMARAWALVLPSRADTSPNVVKEARVVGLPVVVSPHGGHAEYVENRRDGLIVGSENPEEWFAALAGLCADFSRCRAMGALRHKFFRNHFNSENTAKAFLDLYEQLAIAP